MVLTGALVTRLIFQGKEATGVEFSYDGKTHRVGAGLELVLSLGAIYTPKVLMQSGIGDQAELQRLGIPVVEPEIQTPVLLIAGARDAAVPPVNAEFLHKRLPKSKLDIIDAGHFTWEDGADEYAALVTSWWDGGYVTAS
jgi:pimeloyl-ACP methyl ester carboxylesterase